MNNFCNLAESYITCTKREGIILSLCTSAHKLQIYIVFSTVKQASSFHRDLRVKEFNLVTVFYMVKSNKGPPKCHQTRS